MARKIGLLADDVLTAAIVIADRDGLDAVTLSSVARALDVRSPSLYSHVEGLSGLKRALALRAATDLTDTLTDAASGHAGRDALREIAYAYRRFARRRPGLYAAVQHAADRQTDPEMYDALLAAIGPVLTALQEAGVKDRHHQIHTTRAIRSALHGFAELERLGGFGLSENVNESFDRLVDLLIQGV